MVSFRSFLGKSVHNACQKFDGLITLPHMGNLREMILGMILSKSSHVSAMGARVAGHVTPRKNAERYTNALARIDPDACTTQHIACHAKIFRQEPVLLLCDGGDMQKPHARVMKHVCQTVDGSNGHAVGRGYPTFACVAYGLQSKRQMALYHHLYSTVIKGFKSAWDEQKSCFERLAPFSDSMKDRIVVNDRGGDDEKQFLFVLRHMQMSFLTRINTGKTSRHLRLVRAGEIADEAVSVQEIAVQMKGGGRGVQTMEEPKAQENVHIQDRLPGGASPRSPDNAALPHPALHGWFQRSYRAAHGHRRS